MKTRILLIASIGALFFACNMNKSVHVENGLKYAAEGISVGEVKIRDSKGNTVELSNLTYGQQINVTFNDVNGFKAENNLYYPGLRLMILSSNNDTVLYYDDMYSNFDGLDLQNDVLIGTITLAKPMKSNESYRAYMLLWDKKSNGQVKLEFAFTLKPDLNLIVKANKVQYNEIYLLDMNQEEAVLSNEINNNTKYALVFEGLNGFVSINDSVYCGLSLKITGSKGTEYYNNADLIGDMPYPWSEFSKSLTPYFVVKDITDSPVKVEIKVWDKKSDASIEVDFSSNVK